MLLALFLAALDQTVVATAGPNIMHTLHIGPDSYAWITSAYLVASTVLVPVYGKLGDAYGRKRVILVATVVFVLGSVLCALSQSGNALISFRAIQGAGAAGIVTTTFSSIADLFAPAERGRYTGVVAGLFGVASLVGPLMGGFLTDHFGWHWVFLINLPLGAIAIYAIATRVSSTAQGIRGQHSIDFLGMALLTLGVVPLLLATAFTNDTGAMQSSLAPVVVLGGIAALVGFVFWETRAKEPLIEVRLFKDRTIGLGSIAVVLLGSVFFIPVVFMPLFLVRVAQASATQAGLALTPLVMGVMVGNVTSGQFASRTRRYKKIMLMANVFLMAALTFLALTVSPSATPHAIAAKLALVGLGVGPCIPLYTIAIQNAAPRGYMGTVTATTTFFRQMGGTIGVAVLGLVFAATIGGNLRFPDLSTEGVPSVASVGAAATGPASAPPNSASENTTLGAPVSRPDAPDLSDTAKQNYSDAVRNVLLLACLMTAVAFFITLGMPSRELRETR